MNDCVRLPIVAGTFYPSREDQLQEQVAAFLGNSHAAVNDSRSGSVGLIAPHAGYLYSGKVAGAGFQAIAQHGRPDVVVILGANHSGMDPRLALSPHSAWQTPLGQSPVEQGIMSQLETVGFVKSFEPFAHEHSMEVQLPFIQVLWGVDLPIVPICVIPHDLSSVQEAARGLASALRGRKALVIASSDFTHYQPAQLAHTLDGQALDRIVALDTAGFDRLCRSKGLTICGVGAIELMMSTALELGITHARIVSYATSGEVTGDVSSVVGYASVVLTRVESKRSI